jgi:WD40 repeat protein
MTDDASGPPSAGPQAKVFISYSRKDSEFADRLDGALRAHGFETLIDREEIYAFEDWWARIQALIVKADTIIFIISPGSIESAVCAREVAFATELNKRFAPIVWQRVADDRIPPTLARLNFIFFDDAVQFDAGIRRLVEALATNIDWVRQHTEFGEQARRWSLAGRPGPRGLLLRPPALEEAERWISSRPSGAPRPTDETLEFVTQSRQATTRRQRIGVAGALAVAALAAALSVWAMIEQRRAVTNEARAVAGEQLARQNETRAVAGEQLAKENETRAIAGERLARDNEAQAQRERQRAETEEQRAKEARDRALETQSRLLAERASRLTEQGDTATAIQLSLEAFRPADDTGQDRYVAAAERSLADAVYRHPLKSMIPAEGQKYVSAAIAHDGTVVAGVAADGSLTLWEMSGDGRIGAQLDRLTNPGPITQAIAIPSQPLLLLRSSDKSYFAWNYRTRQKTGFAGRADDCETDFADFRFNPAGTRLVVNCGKVRIFDVATGRAVGQPMAARWFGVSANGARVVTNENKTIQVWDTATGALVKAWKIPDGVFEVALSADGSTVLGSTYAGVRVWNSQTGAAKPLLRTSQARTTSVYTGGPTSLFVTDGDDGTKVWRLERDAPIETVTGAFTAFLPNGLLAFTNEDTISLRRYLSETHMGTYFGVAVATLHVPGGHKYLSASGDGKRVLTLSNAGAIDLWITDPPMLLRAQDDDNDERLGRSMAASGDGKVIATASNAALTVWNADTLTEVRRMPLKEDKAKTAESPDWPRLSLDRDGKRILYSGAANGYDIVDAGSFESVLPKDQNADADVLALSPDGNFAALATGSEINIFRLADASEKRQCRLSSDVIDLAFVEADRIAAATKDGKVAMIDRQTCAATGIMTFPADGKSDLRLNYHFGLLTAQTSDRLQVWSQSERKVVFDTTQKTWPFLQGPAAGDVGALDVDGSRILAAGNDEKTIRVFDIASRAELLNFQIDIGDCCFPAGLAVLSGADRVATLWSERGASRLRTWRLFPNVAALLAYARDTVASCLSGDRRRSLGLQPEPPNWCIEGSKWPYDTDKWKAWLGYRRAGLKPPLADSTEWDAWVAAQPKTEPPKPQ